MSGKDSYVTAEEAKAYYKEEVEGSIRISDELIIKKLDIQNNDVIIFKGDYGCMDIQSIAAKLQDMGNKNLIICLNEDTDITTLPERELKALLEALEKKINDEKTS